MIGLALVVVLVGAVIGFLVSPRMKSSAERLKRLAVGRPGPKSLEIGRIGHDRRQGATKGLTVGNPTGFGTPNAFGLDEIAVTLDIASVTADAIRIPLIVIDAPKVTYEWAASGSNIDLIQKNVDAFAKAMDGGGHPIIGGRWR